MLDVRDIMTSEVFTLAESDTLKTARSMMSLARVRHIPIVTSKLDFIGLLTHRDILGATISRFAEIDNKTQEEIDAGIPISEIMRTDVRTVSPDATVREAAETLLDHKYGCLPVVEGKTLVGIVTEADFLKLAIKLMEALTPIS